MGMENTIKTGRLERFHKALHLEAIPPGIRRPLVAVVGTTILLLGVALIFLPGPAFLVIPLGLAVLATEFVWARRLLKKAKRLLPKGKKRSAGSADGRG